MEINPFFKYLAGKCRKDYKTDYLTALRSIRTEYLPKENPPASTLAGVQSLYSPDVMIEIEAIAVIAN